MFEEAAEELRALLVRWVEDEGQMGEASKVSKDDEEMARIWKLEDEMSAKYPKDCSLLQRVAPGGDQEEEFLERIIADFNNHLPTDVRHCKVAEDEVRRQAKAQLARMMEGRKVTLVDAQEAEQLLQVPSACHCGGRVVPVEVVGEADASARAELISMLQLDPDLLRRLQRQKWCN